jgi:hypothetical protein
MSGPVMGFVFGAETRDLRPILGVPGAAYAGPAVLSEVNQASVAPDGSRALVVRDGELSAVEGLKSASPALRAVEGGIRDADLFAWSADGMSAAVYSSIAQSAQIIRNGAAVSSFDLSASGSVVSLALDGGNLVAGTDAGIYLVSEGAEPRLVAACERPSGLVVLGADLFVAAQNRVLEIKGYAGDAALMTFADGFEAVVGVQLGRDRQELIVADSGNRSLSIYELKTRLLLNKLELQFAPETLKRMGSDSAYMVTAGKLGMEPMYVLDGGRTPVVFFVPVGREQ